MSAFLAGVAAGYAIAVPVGAIGALLVTLGARDGWRVGAAGGLGTATVDGTYALLAVVAGAVLAPAIADWREPLRWGSTVVLVVVGVWLTMPAWRPADPDGPPAQRWSPARAYLTVLGLTAVNPATLVYFAALVAGQPFGELVGAGQRGAFVAGAFLASASWGVALTGAGAAAGRWLTGPRGRRWTALVGGAVVLVLAARTAAG
ncbi:LysE family transporter [Cellulomonas sp. HZM]|uniref:LysE family transporter n=1 Tax=Cellulomonas sp. HZM TaxID=1454010 RepID=UPI0004932D62|nr:LysE family transporter [Cellulomonas sp. HZM]